MDAGVIVAGGRSTRFGEADKALADLAGVPMVRRVADRIAGPVDVLVVNCRADQREGMARVFAGHPLPVRYAVDEDPDCGPLAGLRSGLRSCEDAKRAFVVACDAPFVDPSFARYLFDRAAACDAAVPVRGRHREALHAVYRPTAAAAAADRAFERGERRATALLAGLDWARVTPAEVAHHAAPRAFENLNTRTAFEAAARRFDG